MSTQSKSSILVDDIAQKIQNELNENSQSRYKDILKPIFNEFKTKDVYVIDDFTKFYDEEFIDNLFLGILKRLPDKDGRELYLKALRNEKLSKEDVLCLIRYSQEGISNNVNILGLERYNKLQKIFKKRIIGRISKILYSLYKLPETLSHIFKYENYMYRLSQNTFFLEDAIRTLQDENSILRSEISNFENSVKSYETQIVRNQQYMSKLQNTLENISNDNKSNEDFSKDLSTTIQNENKKAMDLLYLAFEDKFRGSKTEVEDRLKVYLPYILDLLDENKVVLDVGCGRCEWLNLMKKNNIQAKGLDLNSIVVDEGLTSGFDVKNQDVIAYLQKQPENSLNAITGFHIVEHLPFEVMIQMFQESFRVLKSGGVVIYETPNPENLFVGAHYFYNDPTHKNPLVPETLQFLLQYTGFSNVEIKRLHTYAQAAGIENEQDDFKNHHFYNAMDYSVIGYKL